MNKQDERQIFIRELKLWTKFSPHPTPPYRFPTSVVIVVKSAAGEATVDGEDN